MITQVVYQLVLRQKQNAATKEGRSRETGPQVQPQLVRGTPTAHKRLTLRHAQRLGRVKFRARVRGMITQMVYQPPVLTTVGTGETFTRNWTTTSPAPPGQAYANCPPPTESKKCPEVADCDAGVVSGGVVAGGAITSVAGAGAGAAAAWYCLKYPEKCYKVPNEPPSIRDDVDVNCVGEFDTDVPACKTTCGQSQVTYTATYKHIISQQGGGALCPYTDDYQYTRSCQATPPCCDYSTMEPETTGSSVCTGVPGNQTINLKVEKSSESCQEDGEAPTSQSVPCQNCYGFWEADACPTGCGYTGGTVTKNWSPSSHKMRMATVMRAQHPQKCHAPRHPRVH